MFSVLVFNLPFVPNITQPTSKPTFNSMFSLCTCAVAFYVSGISLNFHLKLKAGYVLK
jgi:hypothetical protein